MARFVVRGLRYSPAGVRAGKTGKARTENILCNVVGAHRERWAELLAWTAVAARDETENYDSGSILLWSSCWAIARLTKFPWPDALRKTPLRFLKGV